MNWRQTMEIISQRKKIAVGLIPCILATTVFSVSVLDSYAEEKINVKVNYVAKLNELAKAGRPEELNAAPYYKKAFELFVKQPEQLKKFDYKAWPADLSAEQRELLQTWVQQNSEALAQLKKGTQKPHHWHKHRGNSMAGIVLPQLRQAKTLAIALCSRAKLEAVKGNSKEAFSDLLACYRFGTHFTGTKTLIEQLVGIAIRALAVDAGFQILDKQKTSSDSLRDFQQRLQKLSSQAKFTFDFTAEKLGTYDSIQMVFIDDHKGGGYLSKSQVESMINILWSSASLSQRERKELRGKLQKLDRQETMRLADKIYEYFSTVAHKTPWQWRNEDVQKVKEEMTKGNPFLLAIMPAAGRLIEMSFRNKVETDALVTTIAILRYKADNGRLPENLEQLVSTGYLKKLPIDPYSGKPLVYKRTKDNFLLYSFGADFDDDGGVPSKWGEGKKGGDQVFWPVQPPQKTKR